MTTYFEKDGCILVPTDFSETCAKAVDHAKELASVNNHKICVLHVIKPLDSETALKEETTIAKAKIESLLNSKQIEGEAIVKAGDIFTAISEAADDAKANLIVLGTHGKKGMQKLLGSYALKVIDSTKRPVLVIQDSTNTSKYKSIVFPIEVTEEERQKAEHAAAFAHLYNAKVFLYPQEASFESTKKKQNNTITQLKKYFTSHKVEFEVADTSKYSGDFEKQVATYSKDVNADLILIVSDPEKHMFIGGSKEESFLFNKEAIPVMVVTNKKYKSGNFSMYS